MRFLLTIIFFYISIFTSICNTYKFKHISVTDGLPSNFIHTIYKDTDGFMWFGTQTGLCRYDGYKFKNYYNTKQDSTSIPDNMVLQIQEMNNKMFIIETMKCYTVFDKNKEIFYPISKITKPICNTEIHPNKIYVDSKFNIWIYIQGIGCYEYNVNEKKTYFIELKEESLSSAYITDIKECKDGILLISNNRQLICIDPQNKKLKWYNNAIKNSNTTLYSIFIDNNYVWIYSQYEIWEYNLINKKWDNNIQNKIHIKNDIVHSITKDLKGKIWIGTDYNGIIIYERATNKIENLRNDDNDPRSLSQNTIYSIYTSPDGIMWIGTYKKGISYYREDIYKFDMYNLDDITSIEQKNDSCLWLGTNGNGIILWNNTSKRIIKKINTGFHTIVALHQDNNGTLWAGTFNGGLIKIKDNNIYYFKKENNNSLKSNNIWSIIQEDKDYIIIAYIDAGIQKMNIHDNQIYDLDFSNDKSVSSLCIDNNNFIIGTSIDGCKIYETNKDSITLELTESNNKLSNNKVNQIYKDSRGLIWIATHSGINIYTTKSNYTPLKYNNRLLSNIYISSITEDLNKNIWLTSPRDIIQLSSINIQNDSIDYNVTIYSKKDGLQNCDFNIKAIKTLNNGDIAIGGLYGINYFNPDNIKYNKILPKVSFSGFSLFGKEINIRDKINGEIILNEDLNYINELKLKYDQNIFAISLSTDNYSLPEKVRYMYKLEGFKDEWVTLAEGVHDITFTYLNPGNYTLKVKAINNDGYMGDEVSELKIKILPPFWLTWWAFICYFIFAIIILLYARHRLLKHEREKFRLQQIEQEALKNEEINNMKFRFFTNISHELRTPLTLIIAPLEDLLKNTKDNDEKKILQMMNRNAQRLLMLVNQLLDFRKGEMSKHKLSLGEGDIVTFIHGVCDSFLLMAEKKDIQFSFFSGVDNFSMAFDADKIGKIVMNLLSNAFKFTPHGGRINVMIDRIDNENILEIKVSDTGIGISDSDKEHIFDRFYQSDNKNIEQQESTGSGIGLSLVRDFVQLHEGTVDVFDNIGKGSVFVVHIPIKHVTNTIPEETEERKVVPDMESIENSDENGNLPLLLIVDDNEDFRTYLKYILELQYRVKLAENGQKAWDILNSSHELPDLIISDIMMPVMDGNTLCKKIKEDKRTSHIPVILLSAKHATESKLQGLELGADDYVTKPFNITILVLRIRKLIELSRYNKSKGTIDPSPSEIVITSLDEKLIEKAIKYVEDNISRSELSVEELSSELGMSRVHLYKKLLQITGKTPIEFIRVIRLKRAAQLLRESQLHVSEVAFEVGFNNPKYFSRYFKEEFGVLPSVYQEKKGK